MTTQASDGGSQVEYSRQDVRPCRFCDAPVPQPARTTRPKEFCSNAHRAAYRERERQDAIRAALDSIDELEAETERLVAKLHGARQLLARFLKHDKKTT